MMFNEHPFRERFEQEAVAEPHIDYITSDLADFLERHCLPATGRASASKHEEQA